MNSQKKWCPSHKFFYVFFSVTRSLFLFGQEALIILQRATKGAHPRKSLPVYLKEQLEICIKCYNSTTLSMCVVYRTCVSKNSIASQDVIFYLLRYNTISWSSQIKKNLLFSLLFSYSFLVKFSEQHRGSVKVKLTKCDK